MSGDYTVIPLTGDRIEDVVRIERLCFSDPWSPGGLLGDITAPTSRWYGVLDRGSGRLAAFLGTHVVADEGEIVNLATDPAYRRRGLAEALLREFLRLHPGLDRIFLEVRASNEGAMALYAKLGFIHFGIRRNYYENPAEDAIYMRLIRREQHADTGN